MKIPAVAFPWIFVISKFMPMQMQGVHVVALVHESKSIAMTFLNLDGFTFIVRLPVDRPDVESAFASAAFSDLYREHLIGLSYWVCVVKKQVVPVGFARSMPLRLAVSICILDYNSHAAITIFVLWSTQDPNARVPKPLAAKERLLQ